MDNNIFLSEKKVISLLKNLINEVKTGDACKDEYYYETIATANQIVQFQKWVWDNKEKNLKATNASSAKNEDEKTYNSMLCSSPCTKRQAIDGNLGTVGSKTRLAWDKYRAEYTKKYLGTWCTEKKWANIWLNGVEIPALSVGHVKSFQNYIFQTVEKFKIEAGKKYNSMLCSVKPCTYAQAVDGYWGDSTSSAWESYGEKYKLVNPKWDDKDVTYDGKTSIDKVKVDEVTISNGCYYDKNSESWVDVKWLDWDLLAFTSKSAKSTKPLTNFNQNTNQGITASIPYKTEFGSSNVSYYYMKSKSTGAVSDFYITPDGYYRMYGGAYLGKEEPVINSGGVNILDEIKKGNIPLPDGYFRKLDWNKEYDNQIEYDSNTNTEGIRTFRPTGLALNSNDYKIISYSKNVGTSYSYVFGKKTEIKPDYKNAWSYSPPATSVVQIGYKQGNKIYTYNDWLAVYNSPGGALSIKNEFNWKGYTEEDLKTMGILPGPVDVPQMTEMYSMPDLEVCSKITVRDPQTLQMVQVDEPDCANRNRVKMDQEYQKRQASGLTGKYMWWGRRSDDIQTFRKHMAIVLEDWNEDNGLYMGSIFTDSNGKLKSEEDINKALAQSNEEYSKFFTDKKNDYLIPEGIAVEDAPKYFSEIELLNTELSLKRNKLLSNTEYYMGQPANLREIMALETTYNLKAEWVKNKYTTRIFGTESLTKTEYENYLKDRGKVNEYYDDLKKPYKEKIQRFNESSEDPKNWRDMDNTRVIPLETYKNQLDNKFIADYNSSISKIQSELGAAISVIDRNYGVDSRTKTKEEIAKDPFITPPKPEFLGIEIETWHKVLAFSSMAALLIPGLQGAGMALRGLSIIGAGETTVGGALSFALSMADAGIYISENNYHAAGFSCLIAMLGIKAPWNLVERGFQASSDILGSFIQSGAKSVGITGEKLAETVTTILEKKDTLLKDMINSYQKAIDQITKTQSFVESSTLVGEMPWYKITRQTVTSEGGTMVVGISRRSILEETMINVLNLSNRGINKVLAGISTNVSHLAASLTVINGSHSLYDKTYYQLFQKGTLCDVIDNQLKRGVGACEIYKESFGVTTTEDEELLKKAIINFDWRPGMAIPKDYMTPESLKRQEERDMYRKVDKMWATTNVIENVQLPEPLVKTVYVYIENKLPSENSEEYKIIIEEKAEQYHKDVMDVVDKQKEKYDTEEELLELIRQAKERAAQKNIQKTDSIDKKDFYDDIFYNDDDDLLNKYKFKSVGTIIK
jgi:hypothetical protein